MGTSIPGGLGFQHTCIRVWRERSRWSVTAAKWSRGRNGDEAAVTLAFSLEKHANGNWSDRNNQPAEAQPVHGRDGCTDALRPGLCFIKRAWMVAAGAAAAAAALLWDCGGAAAPTASSGQGDEMKETAGEE